MSWLSSAFVSQSMRASDVLADVVEGKWPPMKVFVYPLPAYFNEELLEAEKKIGRDYSDFQSPLYDDYLEVELYRQMMRSPLITQDPEEADMFYVPWYPSIGRKTGKIMSEGLVLNYLRKWKFYDRYNGSDHVFTQSSPVSSEQIFDPSLAHEMNSIIGSVQLERTSSKYTWQDRKNFVLPPLSVSFKKSSSIKKLNKLYALLDPHEDSEQKLASYLRSIPDALVDFNNTTLTKDIEEKMSKSELCLVSGKNIYQAIQNACVPIIIDESTQLAFSGVTVDYSKFVLTSKSFVEEVVNSKSDIKEMRKRMKKYADRLIFHINEVPQLGDAFWSYSWTLYTKYAFSKPTKMRE